ncbi:hypothetical protein BJY04DRAFT_218659 [Aspergillus karnatakaensis]|uniref:uncharacterized protein n=1 Tax=Aspergillus karnatakaensis TaxID=1810916 RepID=UPI003CCE43C3
MVLHTRLYPLPRPPRALLTHSSVTSAASSTAPTPDFSSEDRLSDSDTDVDPEDLFSSFLQIPHLFPDDVPQMHGNPGEYLLWESKKYGALKIMVPSYPDQKKSQDQSTDEERQLQAHFLWSSGMVVAEGIEHADSDDCTGDADELWRVKGEKVLELGAGAALPSLTAALAHASSVTITDHPSSPALLPGGSIHQNTTYNLALHSPLPRTQCEISVRPHEWGTLSSDDSWAVSNKGSYTRIIAADCYWMRGRHANLVSTMKWFLAPGGKIWTVAGFHSGRGVVVEFFKAAKAGGLVVERAWERDLNSDIGEGEIRREWVEEREGEGVENRRRWCIVAVLGHAEDV